MAIVSSDPGGTSGALGVITLEDVIEELIGEVSELPNPSNCFALSSIFYY
jgi:CBS domain containing-hemolysin-like protein